MIGLNQRRQDGTISYRERHIGAKATNPKVLDRRECYGLLTGSTSIDSRRIQSRLGASGIPP